MTRIFLPSNGKLVRICNFFADSTTSPITRTQGAAIFDNAASSPIFASKPKTSLWSAIVADSIRAAGVDGSRPPSINTLEISFMFFEPINTTMVSFPLAIASQLISESVLVGSSEAVTTVK